MMGQWFDLSGDARLGSCATEGCGGQPTKRLEAGGVGSNYCSGCAAKITALPATALPDGMEVEGRDIYECANQLMGYVGPDTEGRLAQFLMREGKAAAALADTLVQAQSALAAMRVERDDARKLAGLGCDANHGGSHTLIKQGAYTFCAQCGETITTPDLRERARTAEAQVQRLTEENEALRGDRDKFMAIAEDKLADTRLVNAGARGEGFGFDFSGGPIPYITEYLFQFIGAREPDGPSNYAEIEVQHNEFGAMTLTLQRRSGKTPHQLRQAAEARIKALEEALGPFADKPDDWTVDQVNAARLLLKEDGE